MRTHTIQRDDTDPIQPDDTGPAPPDDTGFSFAQVIVTMVIVGILGVAIGFTAFQFVGQSREVVLASNTRTAANAIQNTLALRPDLLDGVTIPATGALPDALMSELANAAPFTWTTGDSSNTNWNFDAGDTAEKVRVQMIRQDDDVADHAGAATATAPVVRWLVKDGDAVRLHIRNEDNAWACALIVLRPKWSDTASAEAVKGNLRGIWYDAGLTITGAGLHDCSPATVNDRNLTDGSTARYGISNSGTGATGNDPAPNDGANWSIPYDSNLADITVPADTDGTTEAAPGRLLQRTVPEFN